MIKNEIIEIAISEKAQCFKERDEYFSSTRDVFTARLQSYILQTQKYLEAAVIGEIGNNTFDHNFGFISDYPRGVYCSFSFKEKYVILADYGKGIKQSLLPVLSAISSDLEAVEIAFTKRVSGRSPEQRGNGLKFVSESIRQNNWHLYFQSGIGSCSIDGNGVIFLEKAVPVTGCLAIIDLNESI